MNHAKYREVVDKYWEVYHRATRQRKVISNLIAKNADLEVDNIKLRKKEIQSDDLIQSMKTRNLASKLIYYYAKFKEKFRRKTA